MPRMNSTAAAYTLDKLPPFSELDASRLVEQLETLLADVPEGVLMAGPDHRIVFYNGPAAALLSDGEGHGPGLGRSVPPVPPRVQARG